MIVCKSKGCRYKGEPLYTKKPVKGNFEVCPKCGRANYEVYVPDQNSVKQAVSPKSIITKQYGSANSKGSIA